MAGERRRKSDAPENVAGLDVEATFEFSHMFERARLLVAEIGGGGWGVFANFQRGAAGGAQAL